MDKPERILKFQRAGRHKSRIFTQAVTSSDARIFSEENIGQPSDSATAFEREMENLRAIMGAVYAHPETLSLGRIDIFGRSFPLEGELGGDHLIFVDFARRYDLDRRIAEAVAAGLPEIASLLEANRSRVGLLLADVAGQEARARRVLPAALGQPLEPLLTPRHSDDDGAAPGKGLGRRLADPRRSARDDDDPLPPVQRVSPAGCPGPGPRPTRSTAPRS